MLACNLDDVESRLGGGFRTCRRKGGLEKIGRGEDVQRRPSLIWRENHATFMVDVEAQPAVLLGRSFSTPSCVEAISTFFRISRGACTSLCLC